MTHKQNKFKRVQDTKYCRSKPFGIYDEPHCFEERSRRALLLSSEDVDRMAIESSRARFMMQLVSKPEENLVREFGSYFRGEKNESKPMYVMTSHTSATPIPKRIVPAYPSLVQSLRWTPSVSTYSEDSQTDNGEDDGSYTCRCSKCKMERCRGRGSKRNINKYPRDNIMKFSDNSTMTPKLTDTGCGACTPLNSTPITSEVSMATSDIVVPQSYRIIPIPILKKSDYKNRFGQNMEVNKKPRVTVTVQEAVRDSNKCNENEELLQPLQGHDPVVPPCPNNSENSSDCDYIRKVIYNEGISDTLKNETQVRYPVASLPPMRIQSPMKLNRNFSKVSVMNKCFDKEVVIPYGHRVHSKYHSDCKPSFTKSYRCEIQDDNMRIESPVIFRRTQASKSIRCARTPSIRLPKKVLISDRDFEAFVDKTKSKKECFLSP